MRYVKTYRHSRAFMQGVRAVLCWLDREEVRYLHPTDSLAYLHLVTVEKMRSAGRLPLPYLARAKRGERGANSPYLTSSDCP